MKVYGAYLEDYQTIKIIVPIDTVFNVNDVHVCEPVNINMQLITQNVIDSHYHLEYGVSCEIETNRDYYIYINQEISIHLDLGKIIRTLSFEKRIIQKKNWVLYIIRNILSLDYGLQ